MKRIFLRQAITSIVPQPTHAATLPEKPQLATLWGTLTLGLSGLLLIATANPTNAAVPISGLTGAFSNGSLEQWKERSFAGNTHYELVEEQGLQVLKGHTQSMASIFYTEQKVDLKSTPVIEWSWKVDHTYEGIDQRSRQGDDFPARLYVVAKTGFLPWETLAINYVWSTDTAIGDSWSNPFTDKAHMVVVQSGEQLAGSWVTQQRNIAEDFKTYFNTEITELSGYAVMVDGDNSKKEGTAWFGRIQFNAN